MKERTEVRFAKSELEAFKKQTVREGTHHWLSIRQDGDELVAVLEKLDEPRIEIR